MLQHFRHILLITSCLVVFIAEATGQSKQEMIRQGEDWYYEAKEAYYDGNYKLAQIKYERARDIYEKHLTLPHKLLYKVYNRILRNETKLRNYKKAHKYGTLALKNAIGSYGEESQETANVYNNIGLLFFEERRLNQSISYIDKSIEIHTEIDGPESREVAQRLMNNANNYTEMGNYNKALELTTITLRIYKKTLRADHEGFNRIYLNMSNIFRKQGDVEKALEFAREALRIKLLNYIETHPSVPKYYSNVAKNLAKLKRFEESEQYFKKGLEIYEINYGRNHTSTAGALNDMARIFLQEENYDKALEVYAEVDRIYDGLNVDQERRFPVMSNKAVCKYEIGQRKEAIDDTRKLIELQKENEEDYVQSIAKDYIILASFLRHDNDHHGSRTAIREARKYLKKMGSNDQGSFLAMDIQYQEIKLLLEENDESSLHKARSKIDSSINTLVNLRRSYLGSSSKNHINEELGSHFHLAIKVALRLNQIAPSEDISNYLYTSIEKAKAASFWDNDSEENAYNFGGAPKVEIENIESTKALIANIESRINVNAEEEGQSTYQDSLFSLKRDLEKQYRYLEENFPKYYLLKYTLDIPNLKELRSKIGNKIAVLDYFILGEKLVCMFISKYQTRIFEKDLEREIIAHFDHNGTGDELNINETLYNSVFAEADKLLKAKKIRRVAVVPHGFLHYLSFDRMEEPLSHEKLVYHYAFSYQLRSSDLIEDRKTKSGKPSYLGFAPEWEGDLGSIVTSESALRNILVSLPGTLNEVRKAAALLEGKSFLKREANEENFKNEASEYDILHFATHAYLDSESDAKSCLLLSGADEEVVYGKEDGRLFTSEIADLELKAGLVILSACNTGNGLIKSGEGVMSLSRAFKFAGANSVLMSLWLSNDQSSVPIISSFFANLRKGMTKDVALQQAKIKFLDSADPLMKDDFYWAGFLLNGDISPLMKRAPYLFYLAIVTLIVLLSMYLLIGKRKVS